MDVDHDLMVAKARDSLYAENQPYAVAHYEVPFYMADFALAENKALRERLERAELVIRHYADTGNWCGGNDSVTGTRQVYAVFAEANGYDKAREYLDADQ